MKHANEIFPLALAELFKLAEQGQSTEPKDKRNAER